MTTPHDQPNRDRPNHDHAAHGPAEHRRPARLSRPADEARVYVVAGGDMVAVFDSVEAADLMAATMAFANLDPVIRCLTEAQWAQARAVLRSQQPHITVTDVRPGRAAGAS